MGITSTLGAFYTMQFFIKNKDIELFLVPWKSNLSIEIIYVKSRFKVNSLMYQIVLTRVLTS